MRRWANHLKSTVLIRTSLGLAIMLGLVLIAACGDEIGDPVVEVQGGDPEAGRQAIDDFGCGSCHTIPNVDGADGTTCPPLLFWSERSFIAGNLTNNPDNLIAWIQNPQAIEPGTAMPNLGVSESQARDIAAFLFTLD